MARSELPGIDGEEQLPSSHLEQKDPLLSTKLFVPPLRANHVSRSRLFDCLNAGLDKALILVSAPAGYGKSTLVSSWLRRIEAPSAWISLDEGDNDPIRFLQYFFLALQKIFPTLQPDLLAAFQAGQPSAFESLLNLIINELAGLSTSFVLVLDDFHAIHAQPVLDMVSYLLQHVPPQMHLALLTRTDPPFPLTYLRARNQLVDIRADHLRFTQDEISHFLNVVIGLDLSAEEISAIEARTEGWIASLQLAAITMQGIDDTHRFVTAFTGSHYYIMDYLTEEVLKRQPERVQLFLLQSSILGRMCGPLCEAVVDPGAFEQTGGQAILEDLERMNLFLIPLDNERRWYRYHHLFSEVLNRRLEHLDPDMPAELNWRASQWYERSNLIPEAIQHSLAAGNRDHATALIEQNGVLLLIRGEVTTLLKWIEAVEPYARARPWIYIFKAWAYALTGNLDQVDGMLNTAEELISTLDPTDEVSTMKGTIAAARAHQANIQGKALLAANFARQALEYLPDVDLVSRSLRTVATSLLGDATSMSGDLEVARQDYLESARISQTAGDIHLTIVINSNLANIMVEQGSLRQAAEIYSETLRLATQTDGQQAIIAGRVYVELCQVYFEWNRLKEASQFVQQSLSLCKRWGNLDLLAVGYVMLARLELVRRYSEKVQEAMLAAEHIANNYDLAPRYGKWVKSNLARWWITEGNFERALDFAQQCGVNSSIALSPQILSEVEITYPQEPGYIIFLRLLVAQGEYDRALALSQRLFGVAEPARRIGRMIEVLALQALAFQGKKDMARAVEALEKAFALAQPEGFVRVFLDEGEPMAKLLFLAKSRRKGQGYASRLLYELGEVSKREPAPAQLLVKPLTSREIELLKLIEAGYTNQEIADTLVISMPTVKRHISNIYTKLGATSRTQAVALGKELELFE